MKYSITTLFCLLSLMALSQCIDDCSGDGTRFGEAAGLNNTAQQVSIFGRSAGLNNTGDLSSFFGFNAGRNNTGTSNSFFGHRTGIDNTTGISNSFFGASSGENNVQGRFNSFFGRNSGKDNINGQHNSNFGNEAGANNTDGNYNSFLGSNSGFFNTHGSYNIAIGYRAGPLSNMNNVDSTLYIDVFTTNEPLIYGHFEQRVVRINGAFEAMGGTANGSDINLKNEIVPVEEKDILEKLATIQISEWAYKDQKGVRHIGPMAQDFFKAFGLGNSDKTINTIDADGVSLAAIQALYQSFEEEKKNHEILVKALVERIEILESKLDKIK